MRLHGWIRDMPIRAIDPEEQEDNEHLYSEACECSECSRVRWQRMEREDAEYEARVTGGNSLEG